MKTEAKTKAATTDATVVPLQQFYLSMLCAVINAEKLDVLQQDIAEAGGRLYMCSTGTSAPRFVLSYKFEVDGVTLAVEGRDNRTLPPVKAAYAVGLDEYLMKLQRFLRAHLLEAKAA